MDIIPTSTVIKIFSRLKKHNFVPTSHLPLQIGTSKKPAKVEQPDPVEMPTGAPGREEQKTEEKIRDKIEIKTEQKK